MNNWGPQAAIDLIQVFLPKWPPAQDENGKQFPADAKDELRYRLGIYTALTGDISKAQSILNDLLDTPATPTSAWINPSKQFLDLLRDPEDLYIACSAADFCNPSQVLKSVVES